MIGGILARLSWSQKISMALRAVGASSEELAALDSVVANFSNSPVGYTFLPEVKTFNGLVEKVTTHSAEAGALRDRYGHLLHNPQLRSALARLAVSFIAQSPDAERLSSLLDKLKMVPGVNLGAYETLEDYLAEELLPKLAPADNHGSQGAVVVCRFCKQPFLVMEHSHATE